MMELLDATPSRQMTDRECLFMVYGMLRATKDVPQQVLRELELYLAPGPILVKAKEEPKK